MCVMYDKGKGYKGIYGMHISKGCAKYSRCIKGVLETIFGNMVFMCVHGVILNSISSAISTLMMSLLHIGSVPIVCHLKSEGSGSST